jgi:hypothetical protein
MGRYLDRAAGAAAGAALGAGLIYFLDDGAGARRRARFRDRAGRAVRETVDGIDRIAADMAGRSHGILPRIKRLLPSGPVDDAILTERVRARMGRYVSHPRAIEVEAQGGAVTLRGPILAAEADGLIAHVRWVPGVKEVRNRLSLHPKEDIPALQGAGPRRRDAPGFLAARWSPAARFSAFALGAAIALEGLRKSGWVSVAAFWSGLALCLRGALQPPRRLLSPANYPAGLRRAPQPRSFQSGTPIESMDREESA